MLRDHMMTTIPPLPHSPRVGHISLRKPTSRRPLAHQRDMPSRQRPLRHMLMSSRRVLPMIQHTSLHMTRVPFLVLLNRLRTLILIQHREMPEKAVM